MPLVDRLRCVRLTNPPRKDDKGEKKKSLKARLSD